MDFLHDLYQEGQIGRAQNTADRAVDKSNRTEDRLADLERRLDRVTLASQAMWELLRSTGHFTEEHLMTKMQEVDVRDGRPDGKISGTVKVCSKCRRNSNSRRVHCLYCHAPLPSPNLFEAR